MAADFLSALRTAWDADTNLIGAGLTPLHYDTAPGSSYPYVVVSQIGGGKYSGRNFTKGYFTDTYFRFAIFSDDQDRAVSAGNSMTGILDAIGDNPLTFDDGQQVHFLRMDDGTLHKMRQVGTGGSAYVFQNSFVYHVRVSRERA